jgi:PEP-CTERM motif
VVTTGSAGFMITDIMPTSAFREGVSTLRPDLKRRWMSKERYPLYLTALVIALGLVGGDAARANLLTNGDLETGGIGNIPGWMIGGNATSYGVATGGTPVAGVDPIFSPALVIAHSGSHAAYYVGNQDDTFTLTQSVDLAAGVYDIGVYIGADNPSTGVPSFFADDKIFVDGVQLQTNPFLFVPNLFLAELFGSATLGAGMHSFEFSFNNSGTGANAFSIDDAFVSPPAAPVPEPNSLALLGSAVVATLWFTRRRGSRHGR